jgi:predicted nucleotidyltransferase
MTNSELIDTLGRDLRVTYGCHTAILYGSRARDDWDATSDIDVIAFRDVGDPQRVASRWNGVFLDLFVHSTNDDPDPSWIRINGGRVLFQENGFGDKVLADVEALFDAGPERVPVSELRVRKVWAEKMLERAAKGDAEGDYRRHWLLFVLLEDYFAARGSWYLGPKRSFRTLSETEKGHFTIFEAAFKPSASFNAVKKAIDVTFEGV